MSDRNTVLDALTEEGQPTAAVAEAVGIETAVCAQLLQALKQDGLASCGRGGWRAAQANADAPSSLGDLATLPAPPVERPKAKRGRKPKLATVQQLRAAAPKPATAPAAGRMTFALAAGRELMVIDGEKIGRFSADDTARLANFLDDMRPVLREVA